MMLPTMLYAVALGALLAGAAHFLDRGLRALGRPTRWVWASAMATTGLIPVVSLLRPSSIQTESPVGTVMGLDALFEVWAGLGQLSTPGASTGPLSDGTLGWLWIGASILVVVLFLGTAFSLHRQSRAWPTERAVGEDLLISDGVGPAVVGLFKPSIVLPRWALSLEKEDLKIILLHEAEHRKARDPALLASGILAVALAPWNPGLWWCFRRLRLAVEGDCDGRVLGRGIPRKQYGQLLLGVASGARGLFPLAPALAEGGGKFLERRLQMMKSNVGKKQVGGAISAVLAGAFFLVLACETPTPPASTVETEVGPDGQVVELVGDQVAGGTLTRIPEYGVKIKQMKEDGALSEVGEDGIEVRLKPLPNGVQQTIEASPLIYIDGVRVADGEAKTVLSDLNKDQIDRIEVIKGAAAEALFGPDAANGVIQIFMKK